MKTTYLFAITALAALVGAARADIGAPVVYVNSTPAGKIIHGNAGSLLFQDGLRLVARVNHLQQGKYRVSLDVACSNPLLAFGLYRSMSFSIRALSDTAFRTRVYIKNKNNGFYDFLTNLDTNNREINYRFTFSNNVLRYIHDGGNVVLRLICESPVRTYFRADQMGVSFR